MCVRESQGSQCWLDMHQSAQEWNNSLHPDFVEKRFISIHSAKKDPFRGLLSDIFSRVGLFLNRKGPTFGRRG